MTDVLIVPTGTANTASVMAAFARLGARPGLSVNPDELAAASHVVLPGVGAFAAAAHRLDELRLREPLRRRISSGRATLAICLGMQLFCRASDESPGVGGLGLIDDVVTSFAAGVRVPQLGWNRIEPVGSELLEPGYAYFANTYRLGAIPSGWGGAVTEHGSTFASALERGAVLACQFHPEISGSYGARLLERWLRRGKESS